MSVGLFFVLFIVYRVVSDDVFRCFVFSDSYGSFISVLEILRVTYALRPVEPYIPMLEDPSATTSSLVDGRATGGNLESIRYKVGIIRESILLDLTDAEIDFVLHVS